MIDLPDFSYNCPKTWSLIQRGLTKGVFQCESKLVQSWLKRIEPTNIWELSAVIALVRPGPLESGFAEDYVAYRNGTKEFVTFGHPTIDEVFATTDHVLLYQESLIALANKLAFVDLDELPRLVKADNLRKGVGKKDQAKLVAIGKEFTEGCIRNNVEPAVANKLFEVIKNCGRYLFNLSHSIIYAHLAYDTAWLKANYPLEFTAIYLTYSQFKQGQKKPGEELVGKFKEIQDFILESPKLGIEVLPPNFNERNINFKIVDGKIIYGLGLIKNFGKSTQDLINNPPKMDHWHKFVVLSSRTLYGEGFNSKTIEALVCSGALRDIGLSRKTLLNIHNTLDKLSPKELNYCLEHLAKYPNVTEFRDLLNDCATNCSMAKRKPIVSSLAKLFEIQTDHPAWIEREEYNLLGIALTATSVDGKVTDATHTCVECLEEPPPFTVRHINVVIQRVQETVTKKGKNPGQKMARISVNDVTARLDNIPVFPDLFQEIEPMLIERNTVKIVIQYNKNGWIAMGMEQI